MTESAQILLAEQESAFLRWHFGDGGSGGRFPDFTAIREGKDVFVIPCGPLVKEETIRMLLHVPFDLECKKTESGFMLYPQKVN